MRNFLGLAGVVAGVMFPVALRYYWKQKLSEAAGDGFLARAASGDSAVAAGDDRINVVVHGPQKTLPGEASQDDFRHGVAAHDNTTEQSIFSVAKSPLADEEEARDGEMQIPPNEARSRKSSFFSSFWRRSEGTIRI